MSGQTDPDAVRPPDPRMISLRTLRQADGPWRHARAPQPPRPSQPPEPTPVHATGDDELAADAGVRPFVVTGGRTTPADERLRMETQVVATPDAGSCTLDFESRRIVELCTAPLSVAEIAAALDVPLIVARVLVADLAAVGAVAVQDQQAAITRALLERILERVHAL